MPTSVLYYICMHAVIYACSKNVPLLTARNTNHCSHVKSVDRTNETKTTDNCYLKTRETPQATTLRLFSNGN